MRNEDDKVMGNASLLRRQQTAEKWGRQKRAIRLSIRSAGHYGKSLITNDGLKVVMCLGQEENHTNPLTDPASIAGTSGCPQTVIQQPRKQNANASSCQYRSSYLTFQNKVADSAT